MHQLLDAHHKLGFDEAWAKDISTRPDVIPGRASLAKAYRKLGWTTLANGQVFAPSGHPRRRAERRARSRKATAAPAPPATAAAPPPTLRSSASAGTCPPPSGRGADPTVGRPATATAAEGLQGAEALEVAAAPPGSRTGTAAAVAGAAVPGAVPNSAAAAPAPLGTACSAATHHGKAKQRAARLKDKVKELVRTAILQELSAAMGGVPAEKGGGAGAVAPPGASSTQCRPPPGAFTAARAASRAPLPTRSKSTNAISHT